MPDAPIEFFFDFNSPYGYIAAHKIDDLAAKHGRSVDWKPFLLGAVFKVTGSQPLPEVPMKGDYSRHDFARSARYHGVPFNPPADMPFSPVAASRAVYWAKAQDPAKGRDMALALYTACLAEGNEIASPDGVVAVAAKAGFDADAVAEGIQDPAVKEQLKIVTDDAISRNIFGSPFFVVDGEMFWGADRLDMVDKWLETGGW
ncbi:MAG: 2-hydroxychromene-2-carboxylate isomerase [Alphaproteobacteria bacterium]|nr:2-hydroxychromene-2-carboxylate isomerase [Alphaproteobacteria bacterium]